MKISMNDAINAIIADVAGLSPDAPVEQVLDVRGRIEAATQRLREVKGMIDDAMMQWIEANGDITYGDIRYYVGVSRDKKCRDNAKAADAILTATGGDFEAFAQTLSSNAFKPGACGHVLSPEAFDECFEVIEQKDIKTGKPKKTIQRVDQRFVR